MTQRAPRVAWERRRTDQGPERALVVPADLAPLTPDAVDLLRARLRRRTEAEDAEVRGAGEDAELVLVGLRHDADGPELRGAVDYLVATVADDAAAGLTAEDEERSRPRVSGVAGLRLEQASRAHRPLLGRRLVGPFSVFSSAVFAVGLATYLAASHAVGIGVLVLAFVVRSLEAWGAWRRMPAPPDERRR